MSKSRHYLDINRESWNKRLQVHLESDFYDVEGFIKGKSSLNDIELALLGDLTGKKVLHLQCHFGQDTLSLARLGAEVTGVDLSDKAIERAKLLAEETKQTARFICCDVYDLPNHLEDTFDMVFITYGTIGWLPDLDQWAALIARYLKPGGRLVFVEFHPVVWMFDDAFETIAYRYFQSGAIEEWETGTYANRNASIHKEYVTWNHALSEVVTSLLKQGLKLESFNEYDYSPYDCFKNTVKVGPKQYRIAHLEDKIPMVYSLTARK